MSHKAVEVNEFIKGIRALLQPFSFLEHLPDNLRSNDLLLDVVGYVEGQWIHFLAKAGFLTEIGHFFGD